MKWPFSSRSNRVGPPVPEPSDVPPRSAFKVNDTPLTLKLPEAIVDRLDWLAQSSELSRTDVIRALIYKHLYGEVAYEMLLQAGPRVQRSAFDEEALPTQSLDSHTDTSSLATHNTIQRSPARNSHIDFKYIGPSRNSLPVDIPGRMYDDLRALAEIEGLSISSCVRKLLVLKLRGAGLHSRWQDEVSAGQGGSE